MMTEQEHNNVQWKKVRLGEFIELQGGFAFQSRDFSDSGVPLIRIGDITPNGLNISNSAKLPISYLTEYENFVLNINDTVIAMSGATTGKCTLVTQKDLPALLNQRVGRFRIKNDSIDKMFLYYIVSNNVYQQKLLLDAVGGAQPNVSPKQIESVFCNVPILSNGTPNLPAQRRIAAILASADKVIAATQKTIAKYKQIKQGVMEDLLKPKEGWKMVKLGEFIELQVGFAFQSRNFSDSGVPLIRIGDITPNGLNISNSAKLPISYLTEYENFVLNINDTVIAMSGATTGKCTLVTQKDLPALLNQRVGRFRIKNGSIDNLFLYYIVSNNVYQKKLLLDAVGGAQPNVSPKQIESVFCNVPILSDGRPNLTEQHRIAAILSGIDAKIATEEKVLEKYEKVKKGLMEKMLEKDNDE